ncbi:leucine-rich repeat domain-containing protein (plasmid) [Enterococcus faecium]|uniref:leucine-rich repeat domain-containing protein n=1 Tax=Enterococcus faecium TaxID=1352 RepID=UPI0038D51768
MKCKKLIATLLLSTSVLGTVLPTTSNLAFAGEIKQPTLQASQESADIVPDTTLKHLLNGILGQDKDAALTKEQLASITEITGDFGGATGTLSSLEGLQYCTSLKKLSCMFDGTITDFSVLGELSAHVEFGMLSNIYSNVTKTAPMNANGEVTLVNPYKDVDGTPLQPTTISNEGTYDEKSNSIHWSNLDMSKDYTLSVNYDKNISGLNSSTLVINSTLEVNALASHQEEVTFMDEQLKTGIIQNLNQQKIDGNSTRKTTDPVYKNELEKLETLDLTNKGIQNLSGLENCVNIKTLNLAKNKISDISSIANLKQLVNVDLSDNQLNDISVFKNSTSVETITVNNNNIANIDKGLLLTMPALRHFNAAKNKLTDFTFVNDWAAALYAQSIQLWGKSSADVTNQKVPEITAKVENNEIHVKNPLKGISKFALSNNGTYDKESNTFIWKNNENFSSLTVSAEETNGTFKKGGTIQINIDQSQSATQTINIGGQGIKGYSDSSHDSGFSRVSLEVKDHKASLVKNSDYQFHWSGWKTSKYASIKLTDPNGNVLYDQAWKGNDKIKGNGYQKFGTFAQYDLPEGSTVEIYHAEGPWHRFSTNDNDNLKTKLGKTGYTYTYKMQNNQLVLTNVD